MTDALLDNEKGTGQKRRGRVEAPLAGVENNRMVSEPTQKNFELLQSELEAKVTKLKTELQQCVRDFEYLYKLSGTAYAEQRFKEVGKFLESL